MNHYYPPNVLCPYVLHIRMLLHVVILLCGCRGPVKFRVAFQLDMVATANASRQKLEFSLPCDKLVAKFNALNVVCCDGIAFL